MSIATRIIGYVILALLVAICASVAAAVIATMLRIAGVVLW